jgi:hypothetical protein
MVDFFQEKYGHMTEEEREAYWQLQREKDERSRKLY